MNDHAHNLNEAPTEQSPPLIGDGTVPMNGAADDSDADEQSAKRPKGYWNPVLNWLRHRVIDEFGPIPFGSLGAELALAKPVDDDEVIRWWERRNDPRDGKQHPADHFRNTASREERLVRGYTGLAVKVSQKLVKEGLGQIIGIRNPGGRSMWQTNRRDADPVEPARSERTKKRHDSTSASYHQFVALLSKSEKPAAETQAVVPKVAAVQIEVPPSLLPVQPTAPKAPKAPKAATQNPNAPKPPKAATQNPTAPKPPSATTPGATPNAPGSIASATEVPVDKAGLISQMAVLAHQTQVLSQQTQTLLQLIVAL